MDCAEREILKIFQAYPPGDADFPFLSRASREDGSYFGLAQFGITSHHFRDRFDKRFSQDSELLSLSYSQRLLSMLDCSHIPLHKFTAVRNFSPV